MMINQSRSKPLRECNVLVTGASGFMGGWLTEHLVSLGARVTVLLAEYNPSAHFVRSGSVGRVCNVVGSVLDYPFLEALIKQHGIDTVFHLAAITIEEDAFRNPLKALETNVRGTYNVLEACRVCQDTVTRVIVASSDKAYGDSPQLPYTEDLPLRGRHPYAVSKSCADMIAQTYHVSYGLPVAIGRYGNIYGGGDLNMSRLVPGTVRRLLASEPPLVRKPKDGVFSRDFLYVRDAVQSYIAMFEGLSDPALHGEAFNFAIGGTWEPLDIVQRIQKIMNREDLRPIIMVTDHPEIVLQHVSAEKAGRLLGWQPRYSLDQGLAEAVDWYVRFFNDARASEGARH